MLPCALAQVPHARAPPAAWLARVGVHDLPQEAPAGRALGPGRDRRLSGSTC